MANRCCSKLASQLGSAQRDLARLARLEAYHSQRAHDVSKFPALIVRAREEVARVKKAIEGHEADHAADPMPDEEVDKAAREYTSGLTR